MKNEKDLDTVWFAIKIHIHILELKLKQEILELTGKVWNDFLLMNRFKEG